MQPLVIWEVEADDGWTAYDIATSAKLEDAMARSRTSRLPCRAWRLAMPHRPRARAANVQTGKRRAIRRASVTWRWQDESGAWHNYDHSIARALEEAVAKKAPVKWSIAANGQSYAVDWAAQSAINAPGWAAQVNTVSAVRRAVERVVTVTKLTLPTVDVATTPVDVVAAVTPATRAGRPRRRLCHRARRLLPSTSPPSASLPSRRQTHGGHAAATVRAVRPNARVHPQALTLHTGTVTVATPFQHRRDDG